jgi:2-polyprenyl-6-hydroxyphenyl methylase/3-demethylubiquinone-9 3-methyltransferase
VLNVAFAVLIYTAVLVFLRSNPLLKERGMDFWYDVIDWIGGYPYEYASTTEVTAFVEALGFRLERVRSPRAPTGNNEYIFRRAANQPFQRPFRD